MKLREDLMIEVGKFRHDQTLMWSQAGGSLKADPYGRWWVSVPMKERALTPVNIENQQSIMKKWNKKWDDHMHKPVIIEQDLDKNTIILALQKCLVNESLRHPRIIL